MDTKSEKPINRLTLEVIDNGFVVKWEQNLPKNLYDWHEFYTETLETAFQKMQELLLK
jgi:hypothetical protein